MTFFQLSTSQMFLGINFGAFNTGRICNSPTHFQLLLLSQCLRARVCVRLKSTLVSYRNIYVLIFDRTTSDSHTHTLQETINVETYCYLIVQANASTRKIRAFLLLCNVFCACLYMFAHNCTGEHSARMISTISTLRFISMCRCFQYIWNYSRFRTKLPITHVSHWQWF